MRVKAGYIVLYVDGSGVELPEAYIEGTRLKSGDSVTHQTIDELVRRYKQRNGAGPATPADPYGDWS